MMRGDALEVLSAEWRRRAGTLRRWESQPAPCCVTRVGLCAADSRCAGGGRAAAGRAILPVAGLIILLLLVVQFNSLRRTAIILLTIPLGLIGVVAGLLLAQSYVGFMTLLGIIALAGIIINNAIVLIDCIASRSTTTASTRRGPSWRRPRGASGRSC